MRVGWVVACLAALGCGACGNAMQRGNMLQASYGAYGQPAGYYPGRAEPFGGGNASEFTAWLAKNQASIDDIQRRISEIKDGKRTPGCIGEDKYTCVATLAQKFAVADEYASDDTNIFAVIKYDVNGKPVTGSKIMFDGYPPNAKAQHVVDHIYDHTTFLLRLSPQGVVASVNANLPKDPTFAHTQEEYDATHAYETVSAVTANACPTLGRDEVAKWIENTIKPGSHDTPRQHWSEPERGHADERVSKRTAFCGRNFEFHSVWGAYQQGFSRQEFGGMLIEID